MSYGSAFCAAVGNGYSVPSAVQLLPAGAGEACGVTAAFGDGNSPLEALLAVREVRKELQRTFASMEQLLPSGGHATLYRR